MPERTNFLIGYGERLASAIPTPLGGAPKKHPYSFGEARTRLSPKVKSVARELATLADEVCPGGQSVALMTLHPTYLAKTYYGGIEEACGAVHYVRPDGASLLDRRVYTTVQLKADGLRRTDPAAYREQIRVGYIHGVLEDRPAVISINTQIASYAVNELLARLHPYRLDANADSAVVRVSFIQGTTYREPDPKPSGMFGKVIGRGDAEPLLNMPELGKAEASQ